MSQSLVRTLNDPDASAAQIAAIISKDPALTANLLRMANSAQFGLSRQVLSLDHAITMLGMSRIRSLSTSILFLSPPYRVLIARLFGGIAWPVPRNGWLAVWV